MKLEFQLVRFHRPDSAWVLIPDDWVSLEVTDAVPVYHRHYPVRAARVRPAGVPSAMSLYGSRPAVTKIEMTSKKVGKDEYRTHRVGTRCRTERSGACLGEFMIWFPGHRYVKVDAGKLLDYVQHTDNKPQY